MARTDPRLALRHGVELKLVDPVQDHSRVWSMTLQLDNDVKVNICSPCRYHNNLVQLTYNFMRHSLITRVVKIRVMLQSLQKVMPFGVDSLFNEFKKQHEIRLTINCCWLAKFYSWISVQLPCLYLV